jgi:hypothetical protein
MLSQPTKLRPIPVPGFPDLRVAVKCLDDIELDGCRIEAQRKLRELAKKRGWDPESTATIDPLLMERYVEREVVLRAFFDVDTIDLDKPVPFFASERDLAQLGSTGVTDWMVAYGDNQAWSNPNVELDSAEEKQLLDLLGKGQSADVVLTGIEPRTLRRLLISMAKRLSACRTGKSTTSPTSGASTPSS